LQRSEGVARALTIAGSDSGGGAGVQADLKTFGALGVYGTTAITAVTVQNTKGVWGYEELSPQIVGDQIRAVATDIGVDAAKTGMLGTAAVVHAVAGVLKDLAVAPLVVDPIIASSSGHRLLEPDGVAALRDELLPLAAVVTPNLDEAALLAGGRADGGGGVRDRAGLEALARAVLALGPGAVLLTGGHLADHGVTDGSPDCLVVRGEGARWLEGERVPTADTDGTGCVLSAALTARLALGDSLPDACSAAKGLVTRALKAAVALGGGPGAVDPRGG